LTVPNATLYVVPAGPAAHVSVGVVLTPVAPFAGLGLEGAGGGPPGVPAVVNVRIDEFAAIAGLIGVALVRDLTRQ
jgi:hypothetical protein